MSILNVFVFLLPADSGERVGYAITMLLAIAVFLTISSDSLPAMSNPHVLCGVYQSVCTWSSECETDISESKYPDGKINKQQKSWVRHFSVTRHCSVLNNIVWQFTGYVKSADISDISSSLYWRSFIFLWSSVFSFLALHLHRKHLHRLHKLRGSVLNFRFVSPMRESKAGYH
jgi:hypothetical protein